MPTVPSGPRPIALTFNRHGFTYTQLQRQNKAAIYRVERAGFEVVRIREAKESKLPGGKIAPYREVYPSDEEFGSHGWYFLPNQEEAAYAKYKSLVHGAAN